jgi:hypothetical protein
MEEKKTADEGVTTDTTYAPRRPNSQLVRRNKSSTLQKGGEGNEPYAEEGAEPKKTPSALARFGIAPIDLPGVERKMHNPRDMPLGPPPTPCASIRVSPVATLLP